MNYPFHMPGHKRNPAFLSESDVASLTGLTHPLAGAYAIDTTETPATDDLHHPEGILKDAQNKVNALYADACGLDPLSVDTYFLVGGATAGVLASVYAAVSADGCILAARNAHTSFYHALALSRAHAVYVMPACASGADGLYPFSGAVPVSEAAAAFAQHSDISAVFLTSPTYEGVLSDVASVVRIAHEKGVPVIVDEAHGAHLSLSDKLPESALAQGADLVIHSVHKTLAALTQSAVLHVQGDLIDRKRLLRALRIFQSSSPSYVLMASIDAALSDIALHGEARFSALFSYRERIEEAASHFRCLKLVPREIAADPCKLTVLAPDGYALAEALRTRFHVEVEMALATHIVLILTPYDTREGVSALCRALVDIDLELDQRCAEHNAFLPVALPEQVLSVADAWNRPAEEVPLSEAAGRISADLLYAYPPGTPVIVPGERFDTALCERLLRDMKNGTLRGVSKDRCVSVLIS